MRYLLILLIATTESRQFRRRSWGKKVCTQNNCNLCDAYLIRYAGSKKTSKYKSQIEHETYEHRFRQSGVSILLVYATQPGMLRGRGYRKRGFNFKFGLQAFQKKIIKNWKSFKNC